MSLQELRSYSHISQKILIESLLRKSKSAQAECQYESSMAHMSSYRIGKLKARVSKNVSESRLLWKSDRTFVSRSECMTGGQEHAQHADMWRTAGRKCRAIGIHKQERRNVDRTRSCQSSGTLRVCIWQCWLIRNVVHDEAPRNAKVEDISPFCRPIQAA